MEPPSPTEKQPPPIEKKASFQEMIPRKKSQKITAINACVSIIIKQHWKEMEKLPGELNFFTWSIQNFVRKVKQFVRRYYIT